ncbi:uncharacterized protein LOC6568792 [Drosophila grimshawi]|uniref:GH22899 n=1 Tax=Drosophila grimshawi TaxID=7222 RepID=B4JVR5_DROGR|nr:uncharacterized protein LOC6568792 [Drosophila grimshawi]EDV98053.1 GH22899 [Drosophila grimshawi]
MLKLILLLSLLTAHIDQSTHNELGSSIAALNRGLETKSNLMYTDATQSIDIYAEISRTLNETPSVLVSRDYSRLYSSCNNLPKPLLMILPLPTREQAVQIFQQLPTKMQRADFLLVGCDSVANWLQILTTLWQLGFPNVLLFNSTDSLGIKGQLFTSDLFPHPQQKLRGSSIEHYLWSRLHWFDNLRGWEVRVALYNNPPRTLVYPEDQLYDGYALMLLRKFLAQRGAKFVPVLTPDYKVYSASDCLEYLRSNKSEICGDLLAYSNEASFTESYMYLYGNILIPSAQPRSKNYYIIAPLQLKTWLLVALYIAVICGFASFICWLQLGRWECGKLLLDILSSLLCAGFRLANITGWQHYILFSTIFVAGFICSNYYLAFLKTILFTGLYDPQINSFEELVKQNINIVIGAYDKTVLMTYDYPDILWNITRVVSYDFILEHRRVFDPNYAYLAHSDRLVLFKFQQQYMEKPRMRPLPIDLMHSLPGFPMQNQWLLKYKLSETLLNCFVSGLMQKLADDTNRQTIHIGYLNLIPSEPYETLPLTLDYFNVPLIMLIAGLIIAFVSLLGELCCGLSRQRAGSSRLGELE